VNNRRVSVVLEDFETTIYGKSYIEDILCGKRFRISSKSFYQINHSQTEKLYTKAIEMANISENDIVIDVYSGIGTISIVAAESAKGVLGVELNPDSVREAIQNSKINNMENVFFINEDAGEYMVKRASKGESMDLVIMDPPRKGSDENFLSSLVKLSPKKSVYISCNPETQKKI
jgi:23S rRNA (uracil1939-C5)-methyltransferase